MFGHNNNKNELPYEYYSSELHVACQFPVENVTAAAHQAYPSPRLFIPPLLAIPGEHDSLSALRSEQLGYASSGCSSYGGSPPSSITSYGTYSPTSMIQRSISSHSLHQKNMEVYSPMNSSSPPGYFEPETSYVRKALSTGDLQGVNLGQHNQRANSPLATESSIIESMNRASPYSPEEKKERIERYRSKRNLRNFNKKIKYECRKTLADSRPRIRGRFARNDEMMMIEKTPQTQIWDHNTGIDQDYEDDDDNWINFLDAFSANMMP
ncbi:hypothetical protein DH2020_012191 [Rehmannia glutinosa]|uniref:CCT domain-containing protein n=1 Tax=Rehmannia glutinosa TaxID=99300 RepID=A0ABR0W518_REHGL